jgi:serine/threonine-protein kinase
MAEPVDARCLTLLRAVLDLPPAQHADWMGRECAGDAVLRARLLRLLELDAAGDALLDAPLEALAGGVLAAPDDEVAEPSRAGERIGAWRLVHKLGEGGMGAVWLAERADGGCAQCVALKLIKRGMDSAAVQAQFRRERAVLAHLQHPHIAPWVDGGVDARGRPWFAMQRVEGIGLRDWLQRNPPLRARLLLFLKLCRAVAHAHAQRVVHRDLKPANVMVQADDEPRLLDFGIATLLDLEAGDETAAAQRFLTRACAAPEQLRGEPVGPAADVFALGVLLFELLTGMRGSVVREGRAGVPRPSAEVRRAAAPNAVPVALLRGDLDAIVQRATAEDPARRYGTAQALGDDLERHLHGHSATRDRTRSSTASAGGRGAATCPAPGSDGRRSSSWRAP